MDKDRTFVPVIGLIAFGVMILASGVQAQSPQRGPRSIEIAGVHLGMSRAQAIKALMANEPPFVDDETGGRSSAIELKVPVLSPDPFVWSMKFRAKVANAVDDAIDHVELEFSPPPNESAVLTLSRSTCFSCGNGKAMAHAPSVTNFLEAITKRFGPTASIINRGEVSGGREQDRTYIWSRTGELLTEQEYQRRWKNYPGACTFVTTGGARSDNRIDFRVFEGLGRKDVADGCAALAKVSWSHDGNGVIKFFSIVMTDRAGILAAFSKAAEVIEEKAGQQRKQELDRAGKNSTKL